MRIRIISHSFQARALYDFDAEPGSGEVSIRVGDILTVTRTDVGEGWWEGSTPQGQTGLFPEAYVEEIPVEEKCILGHSTLHFKF